MVRVTPMVFSGAVLVCAVLGCANFIEMQAINNFTTALQKDDIDKLKASASNSFDNKALRHDKDSIEALKNLPLHPDEKITIVKVEDVSATKKKVVVTTEKTHRKMQYNLIRDEKSSKWVVDDIIIRQRHKDVTASKTITEQMDLLLAVQDFLIAWHKGKREDVNAVITTSFARLLKDLPKAHLDRLTKRIAGEKLRPHEFRPEATIDGNDAIVKLQRTKGILILTMKRLKVGWRVADVAIEAHSEKDQMTSARRTATVVHTVVKFLKAYQADDKRMLEKVAATRFYDKCLKMADLKTVPLPTPESLGDKDVVKTHETKLDNVDVCSGEYLIQRGPATIKISLVSPSAAIDETNAAPFTVDDVTFYDAKEQRRLSAVFTAQAKMQLFVNALLKGNLLLVRANSTKDLNYKVWSRLGAVSLAEIVPAEIEMTAPVISGCDYHGAVTNIYVHQGTRELTYVMRDYSGDVTVDDILMPVMDRPASMKETMQAMLPIRLLATALREAASASQVTNRQLDVLRAVTSNDFNRVVWSQTNQIPGPAYSILPRLDMALSTITDTPAGQTILLGDERYGAKVELVRERDTLLVDRVLMLGGPQTEISELKHTLKTHLVRRTGPQRTVLDPMSSHPIATEPARTAEAGPEDVDPLDAATPGGVVPANLLTPAETPGPKKFPNVVESPALPATSGAAK
jgi:hypothetical protein